MSHHRYTYIIKLPQLYHLRFPHQIGELTLFTQIMPKLNFDAFLSRHCYKSYLSTKGGQDFSPGKCRSHTYKHCYLGIMTAGVSRARLSISVRVVRNYQ